MSKGNIPESMDLLLDTMCNTFGGVMFIAISLSLAFCISKTQISAENHLEKVKQALEQEYKTKETSEQQRKELERKLALIKKFSRKQSITNTDLPELVTRLEQECKDISRAIEIDELKIADIEQKQEKIEKENSALKEDVQKKNAKTSEEAEQLQQEYEKTCLITEQLNENLKNIPVRSFHFTRNERTTRLPYVLIVQNDCLYRLGADIHHSSAEVAVKVIGNRRELTVKTGTPLSSISSYHLPSLLQECRTELMFLWIIVTPDSLNAFVPFRRLLRQRSYPVYWYTASETVLYVGSNPGYSASY